MERAKKTSFEDHLNIVEAGQKTASADAVDGNEGSLLDKLAAELDTGAEKTATESVTDPNAPAAEGEVQPAESSVSGAAEPVVAATEAVATPQTEIAGGSNAEASAGEVPAATKPNEGTAISAGDGNVTDSNKLHKTDAAVAEAVEPVNKTASDGNIAEAEVIGGKIAEAFLGQLEKVSADEEYTEALGILDDVGLLDGYKINDLGMSKTAEEDNTDYLSKIAAKNSALTREDIVGGAVQLFGMQKEAEDAEDAGRQAAHEFVDFITEYEQSKEASDNTEGIVTPETAPEAAQPAEGEEKVAALLKDPEVVAAVKVLKAKGVV